MSLNLAEVLEAKGCLGVVAKAGKKWPVDKDPEAEVAEDQTPRKQASRGKAWALKPQS
jgi:hypothetical protein